jgi:hypothetical protein
MPKEDFRRFGHEIIDWIAGYFQTNTKKPKMLSFSSWRIESIYSSLMKRLFAVRLCNNKTSHCIFTKIYLFHFKDFVYCR